MDSPFPEPGATGAAPSSRSYLPTAGKPPTRENPKEEQKENYTKVKNLAAGFTIFFVGGQTLEWSPMIPRFVSL